MCCSAPCCDLIGNSREIFKLRTKFFKFDFEGQLIGERETERLISRLLNSPDWK